MLELAAGVMADFANPEVVGIYKATKLPSIAFGNFLKESVVLFFSIIVFMVVTAMVLTGVAWLILE
jgi:hypothetical protein